VLVPYGAEGGEVARVGLGGSRPPDRRLGAAQRHRAVPPLRRRRHDDRPQIPIEEQHHPRLVRARACAGFCFNFIFDSHL
jgi:hypothetical protein